MIPAVYESSCRVVWNPDGEALVLVEWGDLLTDRVRLDGGQLVEMAAYPRAEGKRALPRNNEEHRLTFGLYQEAFDLERVLEDRLALALLLPRARADVLLWFRNTGTKYRLKNAAVTSWPSDQSGTDIDQRVEIRGGAYVLDTGTYEPLFSWGDNYYLQPPGSDTYVNADGDSFLQPS